MTDTQRTAQELAAELKQARHEYGKALAGCDSKPIRLARALDLGRAIDAAIDRLAALASQAEQSEDGIPSFASRREAIVRAWNDLPESLRCHPGLKALYRALSADGLRAQLDALKEPQR